MFLVDDDETETLKGQEHGTTGPEDDIVRITGELLLPNLHPFGIRVLGVVDTETVAKDMLQALHNLYSQGDLWQEIEHLLLLLEGLTYQVDIDFCLA